MEFKSRPRTHETRSTFFLFRELRIQKLSSRRKIKDCETKAEQLCLWRSFEAFTDFKLPFFARFGLKVSSRKFPQFLPSKPLFDSRNASHQYDLHDRLRKQGRIQDFFLGEGALVSCSTLTPINHIVFFFFFGRIQVVSENRRSSRGGGGGEGTHPLHPPPRSAPGSCYTVNLWSVIIARLINELFTGK